MKFKQISLWSGMSILCLLLGSYSLNATVISREYTWVYDKKIYKIEHSYDQNSYDYYKKLRRTYTTFLTYLDESKYFPVIETLADEFRRIAATQEFSDWQTVECVINFVQSIDYVSDGTYEYPKFPIETLVELGGDCEDSAILLEALLRELGFNAVLVSPEKHMGVGIALNEAIEGTAFPYRGTNYYYIETTSMGWCIGDYPSHLSANAEVYDPGQYSDAKLLSADSYSFNDNFASKDEEIEAERIEPESANTSEPEYQYAPNKNTISSSTIDIDEMVIDGEKQTIITEEVETPDGEVRIIATEK